LLIVTLLYLKLRHSQAGGLEIGHHLLSDGTQGFTGTDNGQSRARIATLGHRSTIHTGTAQEQVENTHSGLLAKAGTREHGAQRQRNGHMPRIAGQCKTRGTANGDTP
jgi:hypothetical protein